MPLDEYGKMMKFEETGTLDGFRSVGGTVQEWSELLMLILTEHQSGVKIRNDHRGQARAKKIWLV